MARKMGTTNGDRTNEHCLAALQMLASHGVPPRPHAYEVYFCYVSGASKDVRVAIDEITGSGGVPDADTVEGIYQEYLAPTAMSEAMLQLSEKLHRQIEETTDLTDGIARRTESFSGYVSKAGAGLLDIKDPQKIAEAVKQLAGISQEMSGESLGVAASLGTMASLIGQLHAEMEAIRADSMTDPLTGVGNRRMLDKSIDALMERCRESGNPMSVCMLDLDHFKAWNDTHGHHMGDLTLKKIASILTANVREGDIVARYGGEEFSILFPNTTVADATSVVTRIRAVLAQTIMKKRSTGEHLGSITASFGLAQMRETDTPSSLLDRADRNLYTAKDSGRNRLECGEDNEPPIADIVNAVRSITGGLAKTG